MIDPRDAEELLATAQTIIRRHLYDRRRLTDDEIQILYEMAGKIAAFPAQEFYEEYRLRFRFLLKDAQIKESDQINKTYYYALMTGYRLLQHK